MFLCLFLSCHKFSPYLVFVSDELSAILARTVQERRVENGRVRRGFKVSFGKGRIKRVHTHRENRNITKLEMCFCRSLVVLPVSLTVMGVTGTKFGEFCGSSTPHNKCIGANKTDGYRVACSGGFRDQYLEDG